MIDSYTLIISEKPQAALRIATALAESKIKKYSKRGAYWLEFTRGNERIVVVPAVGHLFVLDTVKGEGWSYPEFDTEWVPTFGKKGTEFTKKYYDNIRFLVKEAGSFIIATDYDVEGEVIGFNILRFLCNQEDAKRMKFSTLTKYDLIEAYENVINHIDFGQAEAGLTRHYLDFHWGINTTRALTLAMKEFVKNGFVVVSSGRVQSPTLKILTDREIEIKKFVPVPFWQLILKWLHDGKVIEAMYEKDKIWDKDEALKVLEECKNKDALVKDLEKNKSQILPPLPFDTTALQIEAYRCFGFSPSQTMSVAEALYNQALISYPRTSSQKLPAKIGYNKILQGLSNIDEFQKICQELLSKPVLKPREGKKIDPAHIAIYPTGEIPKGLTNQQKNLYNLIVKRFFSVFGEPGVRETTKVTLAIKNHLFISTGIRTLDPGWLRYYSEFIRLEDQLLPEVKKGQTVKVKELKVEEKETQPPKRYSQASILKEMEKLDLGTKATRAQILQTLYDRGYIRGKSIEVTDFGQKVIQVLDEYCPRIVSVELTRKFEEEMEMVSEGKKRRDDVVEDSKKVLIEILEDFKKNQSKIGEALTKAYISFKKDQKFIGKCPECGNDLSIITSRKTGKRFVGCSNYKNGCRFSTPLPQSGSIKGLNKNCDICSYPLISVRFKRKWYTSCTNMKCSSKENNTNKK
jgi:DNA topoisomerase-1